MFAEAPVGKTSRRNTPGQGFGEAAAVSDDEYTDSNNRSIQCAEDLERAAASGWDEGGGPARGTPEPPTLAVTHLPPEDEDDFSNRMSVSRLCKHITTTHSSRALSIIHLRTDLSPAFSSSWAKGVMRVMRLLPGS